MFTNYMYLISLYKQVLALNNLQGLICSKTKPNLFESIDSTLIIKPVKKNLPPIKDIGPWTSPTTEKLTSTM